MCANARGAPIDGAIASRWHEREAITLYLGNVLSEPLSCDIVSYKIMYTLCYRIFIEIFLKKNCRKCDFILQASVHGLCVNIFLSYIDLTSFKFLFKSEQLSGFLTHTSVSFTNIPLHTDSRFVCARERCLKFFRLTALP